LAEESKTQGFGTLEGIKGRKLKKQSVIKLSIKNKFQSKSEVKLGFGGRIQNTKDK